MCSSSALPSGVGSWPLLARVTWQTRWHPEGLEGRKDSCAVTGGFLESSPVLSCQVVVGPRGIVGPCLVFYLLLVLLVWALGHMKVLVCRSGELSIPVVCC